MARVSFDIKEIKRICEFAKTNKKQMALVKDEGIYIMSKALKTNPSEENLVVYAKGYNPKIDEDWWDKSYLISHDDFGEYPPIIEWLEVLLKQKPNARMFTLNITTRQISLVI